MFKPDPQLKGDNMPGFTYKSYSFTNKDPIIDQIRTVYQDSGANLSWVQEHSGVSKATVANWFYGKTKRPQAASVNAVLRSLGYKLGIVPHDQKVQIVPAMVEPERRERRVVNLKKYIKKGKGKRHGKVQNRIHY
jgi:hypothetical protein